MGNQRIELVEMQREELVFEVDRVCSRQKIEQGGEGNEGEARKAGVLRQNECLALVCDLHQYWQ